jgi:L-ascorbate metabolism protein UlaG (beta-lactamase superfamily)
MTEKRIHMKQRWYGQPAFRIEASEAEILMGPFLRDNPSGEKGWSGNLTGDKSTQGGER